MILQELCLLYDRLAADPDLSAGLAHPGWSKEKVAWSLVIDEDGNPLTMYPLVQGEQKYQELMVPEHDGRTSGVKPFFLCDKASYVLGVGDSKAPKCHEASRKLHAEVLEDCDDLGARATLAFLSNEEAASSLGPQELDALSNGGMIVLCLDRPGEFIHERKNVRSAWEEFRTRDDGNDETTGWCSVTGERGSLARLFPLVTGVPGAQSSGASLVSYNFDATESYGKSQAYNASISEDVAFKAGHALKYLLGSRQHRVYQGNTAITFWTDAPSPVANSFLSMLVSGQKAEDEVTRRGVAQALQEMKKGKPLTPIDPSVGYCLLGLSPNAARLSVRFFERGTFGELAEKYGQYLRDTEIIDQFNQVDTATLTFWQMVAQAATLGKLENVPSTLVSRCFSAMTDGGEFPKALPELVRSRIRADHGEVPYKGKSYDVMGRRAAVLKACHVRRQRLQGIQQTRKEEVTVALNRENENAGYLLGRLFAVLERAQQGAIPNANATIRDRYIGAASSTPARVFQPLLRGCQTHLSTLRKDPKTAGTAVKLERELDDIIGRHLPDTGIPKILSADDQDMFFIGYYQERCDLWLSRADREALQVPDSDESTKED